MFGINRMLYITEKTMNLMKSICSPFCGATFLLLTLVACTGNDVPVPETDLQIRWSVQSGNIQNRRALIENSANLQAACSDGGQAIGIWSAYQKDGEDLTEQILGTTGDASLTYDETGESWTYGDKPAYWQRDAVYYFNAYFPKEGGMTDISHTKTSIAGTYDTETTQTDLMVSRVIVDTGNNFQGQPVELSMLHTLATLKFIFLMDGGDASMVLKAFSLDKTLKTSASLNYNTNSVSIANWTNGTLSDNSRIYEWASNEGIEFTAITGAVPYTTGDGIYRNNGGHILIIPQECTVAPTFNCIIGGNSSENESYQNISLGTTKFEPGKNYIYTIKLKQNVVDVDLSIAAWNELNSSFNIPL